MSEELKNLADDFVQIGFYNGYLDTFLEWKDTKHFEWRYDDRGRPTYTSTQTNILWMILVRRFGNYGTSPRSGWIEDKKGFDEFLDYVIGELKWVDEVEYYEGSFTV